MPVQAPAPNAVKLPYNARLVDVVGKLRRGSWAIRKLGRIANKLPGLTIPPRVPAITGHSAAIFQNEGLPPEECTLSPISSNKMLSFRTDQNIKMRSAPVAKEL